MVRRRSSKARRPRARGERWFSRAFWLCALAACVALWGAPAVRPLLESNGYRRVEAHAPLLREVADEFELDPNLLAGVMLAESSGRLDAVSKAGALGLFQLMLPTARERAQLLGLREPTREDLLSDAGLNARLAGSYLRWLLRRYRGECEPALVAYNAGPGRLDGWIKEYGGYPALRKQREGASPVLAYARKVLAYRDRFAERGAITPLYDQPPAPLSAPSIVPPSPPGPLVGPPAPPLDVD